MAPPIEPIFAPTAQRPRAKFGVGRVSNFFKNSFTLPTLLMLGSLLQIFVSFILPPRYALLPALALLLRAVVRTALDLASPSRYFTRNGVIPGRTSAQIPQPSINTAATKTDNPPSPFPRTPGAEGLVVFHLGMRHHHPLGALSPGSAALGAHFQACHTTLLARAREYGCLGASSYVGTSAASHNELLYVYYFRDVAGLQRFAREGQVHRDAWAWYEGMFCGRGGDTHIGVYHETFCVPPGGNYETVYLNMGPTLLGEGSAVVQDEGGGEDLWVKTLVGAEGKGWRSLRARMGRGGEDKGEE